jgi:predicted transcriptional regulator of viral defense system
VCVSAPARPPNWKRLYEIAAAQEGYFTTREAALAGCSPQLLAHYGHGGQIQRVRHDIYRLVDFPAGDHEEFVVAWLWSERAGVLSHQTALLLHGLSDVLPAHIHLTLPLAWKRRRPRVPHGVVLHDACIAEEERTWVGTIPVTNPRRTLNDCATAALAPDLLQQATREALHRGLVTVPELLCVEAALAPFGGIEG